MEDLLDRYLGRESEICVEATIVFRVWRLTVTGLGIGIGVCIWSVRGVEYGEYPGSSLRRVDIQGDF